MKSRPIIFSGESVRAILEGRKTQTRRVMKPQPEWVEHLGRRGCWYRNSCPRPDIKSELMPYAPYRSGDRLWVREAWINLESEDHYKADIVYKTDDYELPKCLKWRNPMFMPRWASRLTLKIINVRVERLQCIFDCDAWSEGYHTIADFVFEWDKLNAKRGFSWDANPWVWVVEFMRIGTDRGGQ